MRYFKNVQSFEDLKAQFKALAKANHPDAGGDPEAMKAINLEYDTLFPIWKNRSGVVSSETASSTRSEFYTRNGWKGENYDWRRDLKDIASIVRQYVKETYPCFKFSVRMDRNYNRLSVQIVEGPVKIANDLMGSTIWKHRRADGAEYPEVICQMADDVNSVVNSYNFEDIDGSIDYFSVGFWFHGVSIAYNYKVVERKAKKASGSGKKASKASEDSMIGDEFTVTETTHTKTGERLWLVKCNRSLSREEYIEVANKMKAIGGYYSRYLHGFVFKADPSGDIFQNVA